MSPTVSLELLHGGHLIILPSLFTLLHTVDGVLHSFIESFVVLPYNPIFNPNNVKLNNNIVTIIIFA